MGAGPIIRPVPSVGEAPVRLTPPRSGVSVVDRRFRLSPLPRERGLACSHQRPANDGAAEDTSNALAVARAITGLIIVALPVDRFRLHKRFYAVSAVASWVCELLHTSD